MLLLDLFISQNKITEEEAKQIETDLKNQESKTIDDLLSERKISDEEILQVRSVLFGLPIYKDEVKADVELNKYLSIKQCRQLMVAPLSFHDDVLYVGVVDPERSKVLESLQFLFNGKNIIYKVFLISYTDFKKVVGEERRKENIKVDDVVGERRDGAGLFSTATNKSDDKKIQSINQEESSLDLTDVEGLLDDKLATLSVPEIISKILRYAIDHNASDIHIENIDSDVRVRCRVDGVLNIAVSLPKKIHSMLIARIKILCQMKLDEKRKPQDGRFSTKMKDHSIDYRVSTFPSYFGEKVAIRILDNSKGVRSLETLDFRKEQLEEVRRALTRPFGIILISGPTGSGKTSTLYSMLGELDREHRNVVSLEDPIEYNVPSINQSQIFPEIGYTFASGLRSILRQDPDVIMVGEIRDSETAELAIQAALTGHLVFSTIHTNTSVGVITRLLDMGIEPYLIAPTLNLAISQRLVRKIEDGHSKAIVMDPGTQAMLDEQFKDLPEEFRNKLPLDKPFTTAEGYKENPSGMKGRTAVFEVLTVTDEIEDLILKHKSEDEIWAEARKGGAISVREDAMLKSIEGKVPFSEIHEL